MINTDIHYSFGFNFVSQCFLHKMLQTLTDFFAAGEKSDAEFIFYYFVHLLHQPIFRPFKDL